MADRKPLIVLAALAVLALVVYLVAVVGAGREDSTTGLPDWATPEFSPGSPLRLADLSGSSGCTVDGPVITFTGTCRVTVRPVTGGWPWEAATRRALLVVAAGPVGLRVTLAGKALSTDLDPGDDIRLTYTREGGDFTLACSGLAGCAVTLTEDS